MIRTLRAVPLVAATVLVGVVGPAPGAAQEGGALPTPLGAVQVTANPDPARAHSSSQIARNPRTGELVIGEAEVRNDKRCRIHISVDDGRSWAPGGDPMVAPNTDCTLQATNGHYISFQFTDDGVLWAAFLGSDPALARTLNRSEVPRHVFLARSEDSGRTWRTTTAFEARQGDPGVGGTRRPLIAVDPVDHQNVYIGWQKGGGGTLKQAAMVSVSRDGGRSFGAPVDVSDEKGGTQPRVTVDSQGIVHAIFTVNTFFGVTAGPEGPPVRPLVYTRSSDGGATWAPPVEIDSHNAGFQFGRKSLILADPNSSNIYVTWYGHPDPRARRPAAGQPSTAEFGDRDIFVRVSADGGATWSDRITVNDDAARPNIQHYDPGISIAPNGRLDIAWYDFRNSPTPEAEESGGNGGGANDVYYAYSTDGGLTFSENVRVTDRSMDRTIGVWSNNVHSHTNVGIASTDDQVYVTWQDTRNGGDANTSAEDIYFAALRFSNPADSDDDDVPAWILVGAAVAVGMGLTILVALGVARSRRPT